MRRHITLALFLLLRLGLSPVWAGNLENELLKAVLAGDVVKVKALIEEGADVNAKNENGWSPLHWAVMLEHKEIVELLIAHGADVNAKNKWGWTPLHMAALFCRTEIAKFLLSHGADVNAKSTKEWEKLLSKFPAGSTPLDVAKLMLMGYKNMGYDKMVSLLRSHGGKCNTTCGK